MRPFKSAVGAYRNLVCIPRDKARGVFRGPNRIDVVSEEYWARVAKEFSELPSETQALYEQLVEVIMFLIYG